jgi:hypothetical protein
MFGSAVLDAILGLIFVCLTLSLICSAACELIESFLRRRARYLYLGLRELLGDPDGTRLLPEIYGHPLISSLHRGSYGGRRVGNLPSYIPARSFALALMDVIGPAHAAGAGPAGATLGSTASGAAGATAVTSFPPAPAYAAAASYTSPYPETFSTAPPDEALRNAIVSNLGPNPHTAQALLTLAEAAHYDPVKVRENIEGWFNASMDRVSGWYKRTSNITILGIGVLLSFAIDADTIRIINALGNEKVLASLVSAGPGATVSAERVLDAKSSLAAKYGDALQQALNDAQVTVQAPGNLATPAEAAAWIQRNVPAAQQQSVQARFDTAAMTASREFVQNSINDASRVSAIASAAGESGFRFGWPRIPQRPSVYFFLEKLLGIGLTALAISLLAPLWFDTLNRFTVVRSAIKPKETNSDDRSKL